MSHIAFSDGNTLFMHVASDEQERDAHRCLSRGLVALIDCRNTRLP